MPNRLVLPLFILIAHRVTMIALYTISVVVNVHLFTYGSLMFPEVWSTVVKGEYERMAARLYSY